MADPGRGSTKSKVAQVDSVENQQIVGDRQLVAQDGAGASALWSPSIIRYTGRPSETRRRSPEMTPSAKARNRR